MNTQSAVPFETNRRIHIALAAKNLDRSLAFYRALLGQEPTKVRPHYAKFEVAEPPVNLAINEVGSDVGTNHPVAHFGIQVKSTAAVSEVNRRLNQNGTSTEAEDQVTCCYAVQNKVWAIAPDGKKWEVYVVLEDDAGRHGSTASACCPELPSVIAAVQQGDSAAAKQQLEKAGETAVCS